jgi:hypothetical protein
MIPVSYIVPLVRQGIQDTAKTIVAADSALYPLILSAVRQLHSDIPEMALNEQLDRVPVPDQLAAGDDPVPVSADFLNAVADYACYRYYLGDIGSVRDERRANEFLAAYDRQIVPQEK